MIQMDFILLKISKHFGASVTAIHSLIPLLWHVGNVSVHHRDRLQEFVIVASRRNAIHNHFCIVTAAFDLLYYIVHLLDNFCGMSPVLYVIPTTLENNNIWLIVIVQYTADLLLDHRYFRSRVHETCNVQASLDQPMPQTPHQRRADDGYLWCGIWGWMSGSGMCISGWWHVGLLRPIGLCCPCLCGDTCRHSRDLGHRGCLGRDTWRRWDSVGTCINQRCIITIISRVCGIFRPMATIHNLSETIVIWVRWFYSR